MVTILKNDVPMVVVHMGSGSEPHPIPLRVVLTRIVAT
jgi:hypothetical protein